MGSDGEYGGYQLTSTANTIAFLPHGLIDYDGLPESDCALRTTAVTDSLPANTSYTPSLLGVCFGLNSLTPWLKVNLRPAVSGTTGTRCPNEETFSYPGSFFLADGGNTVIGGGHGPYEPGLIYEGYAAFGLPFTDAAATQIQMRMFQHFGANKEQITISRNSVESYEASPGSSGQTLTRVAENIAAITPTGLQSLPAVTNYVKGSEAFDNSVWTKTSVTYVANNGYFADATKSMEKLTSSVNTGKASQAVTVTSSTGPFTASAWMSSVSGTAIGTVGMAFGSGNATACTCWRSDGGACTTGTATTNGYAYATVGTIPSRLAVTCSSTLATTSVTPFVTPGQYGTSTGVVFAGGYQFETNPWVTPYIFTGTSAAVTSEADVVTVDNALAKYGGSPSPWCVDVKATPYPSRAWGGINSTLTGAGTISAANTWRVLEVAATGVVFEVVDAAAGVKTWTTSGLPAAGTRRITACYPAGSVWFDGVSQTVSAAGAGTGVLGAQPTALYIGTQSSTGAEFTGSLQDYKLCYPATSPADCDRQPKGDEP
jgi:hypothetical protein